MKRIQKKGQIYLEILIAVTVFTVTVSGLALVVQFAFNGGVINNERDTGSLLMKETFEVLEGVARSDWHSIYKPLGDVSKKGVGYQYGLGINSSGTAPYWELKGGGNAYKDEVTLSGKIYKRYFTIQDIDKTSQDVTVTIEHPTLPAQSKTRRYSRHYDNQVCVQTDWSGGFSNETFLCPPNAEKYSAEDDISFAAGEIKLSDQSTDKRGQLESAVLDFKDEVYPLDLVWEGSGSSGGGGGSPGNLSFDPAADASVKSDSASTNFGSDAYLNVDAGGSDGVERFLIRFNVTGVGSSSIQSAKLRLCDSNPSNYGGDIHFVASNTWGESSVNWDNQPAHDAEVMYSVNTAVEDDQCYEWDVKSKISGDGTYSFKMTSPSNDGADYRSREYTPAGTRPKLNIVTGGDSSARTETVNVNADASIFEEHPNNNYGSVTRLEVDEDNDGAPSHFMLKFGIGVIGADSVNSAKIKLCNSSSSDHGGNLHFVSDNSWVENAVTWNNAPQHEAVSVAHDGVSSPEVSSGNCYFWNVTPHITGDGTYSFKMTSPSDDGADYRSKEYGTAALRPVMIIDLVSSGTLGFKLAAASDPSGPWSFIGPLCATDDTDVYSMDPGIYRSIPCDSLINKQYFKYKVILEGSAAPIIEEVRLRYVR